MTPEPIDPSRSRLPSLMDASKARPPSGDLDYSKFAPRKAGAASSRTAHYDTSKYLAQMREEDPWPNEDAFHHNDVKKVTLVTCDVMTPPADHVFERLVKVRCQANSAQVPDDKTVRIRLQWRLQPADPWKDFPEVQSRLLSGNVGVDNLEADLVLMTPSPKPNYGQDVHFQALATNNQAQEKASASFVVRYLTLTEYIGSPEVSHEPNAILPRIGVDGILIDAMAVFLKRFAVLPAARSDVAVVFGFANEAETLKKNRKLSLQRAEILKSLLDHDVVLWEKHRKDFTTREKQQILSDIVAKYGWDCDPGPVDGLSGPKTWKGVRGFQKEYNARYVPRYIRLTEDGVCGRKTWGGIHLVICSLIAKSIDPALAGDPDPAWGVPDWHYATGQGAYPNGQDFPHPARSAEINLFHPIDAPALVVPTENAALTMAENPVEDPGKFRKAKIPLVEPAADVLPDRAIPVLESYDPANETKRVERSGAAVEIRQWVNLTTADDGRDGKGAKLKLHIRSKGAVQDEASAKPLPDQIFLKVVFSADGGSALRCPRSSSAPPVAAATPDNVFGLVQTGNLAAYVAPSPASLARAAAGGWQAVVAGGWEYTATVNTFGQKVAEIELDLGLCGGDTCEVRVGPTNACDSARVRYVNWRKLFYQFSSADVMTEFVNGADGKPRFSADLDKEVDHRLGAGYVKYERKDSGAYPIASVSAGASVTGPFVGFPVGSRARFVHGWGWPEPLALPAADSQTVNISFCDRAFGGAIESAIKSVTLMQRVNALSVANVMVDPNKWNSCMLEAYPGSPMTPFYVTGYTWEAQVTQAANPGHPGLDATGQPRTGPVDAAWFHLFNYKTIGIMLPIRSNPADPLQPGDLAGTLSATHCPIKVTAEFRVTPEVLGLALSGKQIIVLEQPANTACVLSHELGHLMGLSAFINGAQDQNGSAPGMPVPLHVDSAPTQGRNYLDCKVFGLGVGNGLRDVHRGPHCAAGVPAANLTLPEFGFLTGTMGTCIMYGASNGQAGFCPDCLAVLKSRTLENIRANWSVPTKRF